MPFEYTFCYYSFKQKKYFSTYLIQEKSTNVHNKFVDGLLGSTSTEKIKE